MMSSTLTTSMLITCTYVFILYRSNYQMGLVTRSFSCRSLYCTLHLSRSRGDRWGATDIATLSLHLILFSASLRALQNLSPAHSKILFSQRFFCRPLLLPPCTAPCKIVLASPADLETCPNDFNLRFFTMVKISS